MPACPTGLDHLWQRGGRWPKDEGIRDLAPIGEIAAQKQPMASIRFPLVQHGHTRPVKEPGAFGALAHREALPILLMQQESFHFADCHPSALSVSSQDPNRFSAGHGQHIGIAMRFQPGAQVQVAPVDRIGHHPGDGEVSLEDPLHHLQRQFRLGLETDGVRNACGSAALAIFHPGKRQIEFSVDEAMSRRRHIAQKHAHLTVLDLPAGAAVLHLDAGRLAAALGEAALVDHYNGIARAELLQDVATQVLTHETRIPDGAREQAVHAVRGGFPGVFGQLPAIFAFNAAQDPLQISQGTTTRFCSGKAGSNAGMQLTEGVCPLHDLGRGRFRFNRGDMLVVLQCDTKAACEE